MSATWARYGSTPQGRWTVVCVSAPASPTFAEVKSALTDSLLAPDERPSDVSQDESVIRVAAVGRSIDDALGALEERLESALPATRAPAQQPVFMFTGQGSQTVGMGRGLLCNATFRETFCSWCERLSAPGEQPLFETIYGADACETQLADTWNAQRALFALEVALATLWIDAGVVPGAVIGHSVGELAAAYIADVMSWQSAVTLMRTRAAMMSALPRGGAMLAVRAAEAAVAGQLQAGACIAAMNGPKNTVISGSQAQVADAQAAFEGAGIACQRLNVSHAFHSAAIDPMLEGFRAAIAELAFAAPRVALASNMTGELVSHAISPGYWVEQVRAPVRYAQGVRALYAAGHRLFLEVGPAGTLKRFGSRIVPEGCRWLSSLEPEEEDAAMLLGTAASLFEAGASLDWKVMLG